MSVMTISTLLLLSLSFGVICYGRSVIHPEETITITMIGPNINTTYYYGWRLVMKDSPIPGDAISTGENATVDSKTYIGRKTFNIDSLPFYEQPPIKIKVNTATGERSSFTDYNNLDVLVEILTGGNLKWVPYDDKIKNFHIAVPLWERYSDTGVDAEKNTFICKFKNKFNDVLIGKFNQNSNGTCITDVFNPLSSETSSSTFELLVIPF